VNYLHAIGLVYFPFS